jgi:hypothetical protein
LFPIYQEFNHFASCCLKIGVLFGQSMRGASVVRGWQ